MAGPCPAFLRTVPSPSTAHLLREKGSVNPRVVGRGVDGAVFSFTHHRSPSFHLTWGASGLADVVLSVGQLSAEKDLGLVVWARCAVGAVRLFYYSFMVSVFGWGVFIEETCVSTSKHGN
ncbi:hypothetical protein B0H13DRAFT_2318335 [Mycena leptocephala]|nr:hypothetical protein B0H13DRAFT_2318335 [Mycena leptocephala]